MASSIEHIKLEAKQNLSSLIISSAKGLTVKRLSSDYCEMIGTEMPFKQLGFRNVEEYLLSMPDVCFLEGSGDFAVVVPVVTEKNKHMNEMIVKQKSTKSKGRYQAPKRRRGIYNIENKPPVKHPPLKPIDTFKFPSIPECQRQTLLPPPSVSLNNNSQNQINRNMTPFSLTPDNHELSETSGEVISGNVPDVRKGVELLKLFRRVESQEEDESDADDYLFQELNLLDDDDDFNYVSDDEEDLTALVERSEIPSPRLCPTLELPLVEEPHISRVNKKVKDKLKILISEHPDGIWCCKLLRLYKERFRRKLDPLKFGFGSVIEMCDDLPDIFYCIRPNRTDWRIYDKTKPIPDLYSMREFSYELSSMTVIRGDRNTEPLLPANILFPTPTSSYSDKVLHPKETINRQWLTDNEKLDDYIELVISEVYDPSKFWIQLKSTADDLGKLMDDMQEFYTRNANSYLVNEFNVRIGLVCAAVFMNEYHRAIVIKIVNDQTIKVFYCDYGTVSQVSLRKTCFLLRNFAHLPMQAIRARLANVMPKGSNTMWPRDASNLMLSLTREKDLVGYIKSIDYEQEILDLIVTDTTKPDIDIHVNDVLVEEGFAVLGNEAPLSSDSNATVPNVHLYPAFEELENAIYPCVSDVITMLKLGHTYETIFHGYFATSASSSQVHDYSDLQLSRCSTSFNEAYSNNENCDINEVVIENRPETNENQAEYKESNSEHPEIIKTNKEESDKTTSNSASQQIRPPPGFEKHQPITYPKPQLLYDNTKPMYPIHGIPLTQNSVPIQNYSMLNTYSYNLLTNSVLYDQIMMNQENEAYLGMIQQVNLIEEMRKLQLLEQQQMNEVVNSLAQGRIPQADFQPQLPCYDNEVKHKDKLKH